MNDIRYLNNSLVLRQDASTSSSSSDNKVYFEGTISSRKTDTANTTMSETALRSYAKNAREGVPVLPEHKLTGQPIGRSTGGKYNTSDQTVTAKFYIQRGLKLNEAGYADTDSYIESMQAGTTTDLSVGAKVDKETCDFCGMEMRRFKIFGMAFVEDSNGHFPGQKIYVDRKNQEVKKTQKNLKELTITSTIQKADLKEFSSVTFGSNPDSKVFDRAKEAFEQGQLEERHLHQLSLQYNISRDDLESAQPLPKRRTTMSTDNEKTLNSTELIGLQEDKKRLQLDLDNANQLKGEIEVRYEQECAKTQELEQKIEELEDVEELYHKQEKTLAERDDEIKDLQRRTVNVAYSESKAERYDRLCDVAREEVIEQYIRASGRDCTKEMIDRKQKHLDNIDDYEQLKSWASMYRDDARRNAIGNKGTITPRSSSTKGSDDINVLKYQ